MDIPRYIKDIIWQLVGSGYEAYFVGGCVRDLLMNKEPKDWDITTNARPEEIQKIFPDSVYENQFGTVGVKISNLKSQISNLGIQDQSSKSETQIIEITTYRKEEAYTDKRHPDAISFAKTIEEDLGRRDFSINAIALKFPISNFQFPKKPQLSIINYLITDPFNGRSDIEAKTIRAVGNPEDRFNEDALRLMRAVRFAAQLGSGWEIESQTKSAIKSQAHLLKMIAHERVRDELIKLIESNDPERGIMLMQELGLLKIVLPELEEGVGVAQNLHHIYTVFDHSVKSLGFAARYGYSTEVRLAGLLHDIGKPRTKAGEGTGATFYGHEYVGCKMAARALERLRFPKDFTEKVYTLIRYHMFYYNVGEVTARSVRRLVRKVGPENIQELLQLRQAERKGSGVPKAEPYKLRHLKFMIEKVSRDPLTVGMLTVNGDDVIQALGIEPGPKVGYILNALLEEVIDEPERNDCEYLLKRMQELNQLPESELIKLAEAGKDKLEEEREKEEEEIKGKYHV